MEFSSITELAPRIETGELSPVRLTEHILERIERFDGTLHSFTTVTAERALDDARTAEEEIGRGNYRGSLHGIPVGVKDLFCTAGIRTMGGSKTLANHIPDFDATAVSRLRAAGGIVVGKQSLTEGAFGGYSRAMPVPRNPWKPGRFPGASSSGSGVAVAAGFCFGALGTDTGGSIRLPSSCNAVTGLKPTGGRVSRHGVLPLAESFDTVGQIARSAVDAAIIYEVIAGYDDLDPTSLRHPVEPPLASIDRGVEGLRIGLDREYVTEDVHPAVVAAFFVAIDVLEEAGATIVPIKMPPTDRLRRHFTVMCSAEALRAHRATYPSKAGDYGEFFRTFLEAGEKVTGADYAAARHEVARFAGELSTVFEAIDLIACPANAEPPFPMSEARTYGRMGSYEMTAYNAKTFQFTTPYALTRRPTITMPSGFDDEGLPLSIQLVGRPLDDALLLRAGAAYQLLTNWHHRHPDSSEW